MGFEGFYPDGTDQETANPISDLPKPTPVPADQTPELVPKQEELLPTPDEALAETNFVIDTFHNITSVNTSRAAQVIADLKGYAEGSAIKVTYYKYNHPETNSKGAPSTADVTVNRTHKSALKIHGFEMRMLSSLSYEHNTDDNVSVITGEAVTYPGFEPSKGDKFLMEIETGKWGEMDITAIPVRTAIKSSTYFKIQFALVQWMSEAREAVLDSAVVNEAWFDKKRFLNEPGALLYHAEYVDMKFMELQSAQMVTYYNSKFLDRTLMFSYMRPDSIYDAYVTDFMLKITEFNEAGQVAAQLFRDAPSIETSIWRALLSETIPLAAVPTSSIISKRSLGSKTVLANSLLNRYYLAWEPDSVSLQAFFDAETTTTTTTDPCANTTVASLASDSDNIIGDLLRHIHPHFHECVLTCCGDCSSCCGDTVTDDSNAALAYLLDGSAHYKAMIRTFLKERKINVTYLRECIKNVYALPPIQQFYKMPVYIYLARTAVRYIHRSVGIFE